MWTSATTDHLTLNTKDANQNDRDLELWMDDPTKAGESTSNKLAPTMIMGCAKQDNSLRRPRCTSRFFSLRPSRCGCATGAFFGPMRTIISPLASRRSKEN